MSFNKKQLKAFIAFFASNRFFYIIIGLFILQASWIALSNNYGSPHDEKYHFGLIQVYSHNVSPFIKHQPKAYDQYGDVTRNASYLFHYLMSIPYRLISVFSGSITKQVIFLRLFNILFVAAGLLIFKKVLDDLFKRPKISNLALFGTVMIPVFPYVAAGINYDNLVFLGFASITYLTADLIHKFNITRAILWLALIILTTLVKYPFAPLGLAIVVGVLVYYLINRKSKMCEIVKSFTSTPRLVLVIASLILVLSTGLFMERYLGNIISYGSPTPDCAKVLNSSRCSYWGPRVRDMQTQQRNVGKKRVGLLSYTIIWIQKMEKTGFGIYKTGITKSALTITGFMGWILFAALLLFSLLSIRYIISIPVLSIMLFSTLFYISVLFLINFQAYQKLGASVAIQARYLILVMPLLVGLTLALLNKLVKMRLNLQAALIILWLIVFLQGGVVTYILRSDSTWWWPRGKVITVNRTVQKVLKQIVPGA